MGSMTAQLLVGQGHRYHDGIFATHVASLSENSRPSWLLEPTGRSLGGAPMDGVGEGEGPEWTREPTIWVPSGPENILADGLLLLAVHVLRMPSVLELVE